MSGRAEVQDRLRQHFGAMLQHLALALEVGNLPHAGMVYIECKGFVNGARWADALEPGEDLRLMERLETVARGGTP